MSANAAAIEAGFRKLSALAFLGLSGDHLAIERRKRTLYVVQHRPHPGIAARHRQLVDQPAAQGEQLMS
jgi:hypothetical protein